MEKIMFNTPMPVMGVFFKSAKATFLEFPIIKIFITTMLLLAGNFNEVYLALVIALVSDLITGVLAAFKEHIFEPYKLRCAVGKWMAYFLLLVLANQASSVSSFLYWMPEATAIFIFLTEYNSVADNLNRLGFPVPTFEKLTDFIKSFRRNSQ